MKNKKKGNITKRTILIFFIAVILLIAALSVSLGYQLQNVLIDKYSEFALSYVKTAAECIDGDKISEYTEAQAEARAAVADKYGFTDVRYALFHRVRTLSAAEYRKLIGTYSDHITIEKRVRERFFDTIEDTINRHGGFISIFDTIDIQLARKP